jgi:hypothetical protein
MRNSVGDGPGSEHTAGNAKSDIRERGQQKCLSEAASRTLVSVIVQEKAVGVAKRSGDTNTECTRYIVSTCDTDMSRFRNIDVMVDGRHIRPF